MFQMSMNLKPLQFVLPVPKSPGDEPQIHTPEALSHEAYHADRSAVSSSQLKLMLRSPLHFQHGLETPNVETPALRIGTAIHTALLEPERFRNIYRVAPEKGRSAADKLAFANYVAAHPDKVLISRSEMDMIAAVQSAVAKHQLASKILRMGQAETSIFWHDQETGIRCKCRPDLLVSPWLILDIKTTEDASEAAFMRSCAQYHYDLSAAMYREGVWHATQKSLDFVFLAIEKKPPYAVALYRASDRFLDHGDMLFRRTLSTLKDCRHTGRYPGYQPEGVIRDIDLPHWYR
jgi:hypothetical protein